MSRANRNGFQRTRCLRFEALEDRRVLSTVTVSALSDVTDGDTSSIIALIANPGADNKISLREAIDAAEHTGGANEIKFSTASGDGLNGGTTLLTQGELSISESLTIDASMLTNGLTIDANDPTPNTPEDLGDWHDGIRIFNITDPSGLTSVTIIGPAVGLTLTGGDPDGDGGAILAAGNLTLSHCMITNNTAKVGGGVYFGGHILNIQSSHITGNDSLTTGGGLYSLAA